MYEKRGEIRQDKQGAYSLIQSKPQLCLMGFEHFALGQTSLPFLVCSPDLSSSLTDTIFIPADHS